MYEPYKYLLSKHADDTIEKYINKSKSLREFVKEIDRLKKMADEISKLPPYAPMHLYWIDCTRLHKVNNGQDYQWVKLGWKITED